MNLRQIDPNGSRLGSTTAGHELSRLSEVHFDGGRTHNFLGNIGESIDYEPCDELSDDEDEMFSITSTVNEVDRSSLKQSLICEVYVSII